MLFCKRKKQLDIKDGFVVVVNLSANTFIEKVNEIPVQSESDAAYIQQMLGEAHAHIAYQYFKFPTVIHFSRLK